MKTLDRVQDQALAELALVRPKRRSYAAFGAVLVVVAAVAASVSYMAASPRTITKTKTVTVAGKVTPTTLAPTCAPGAAAGSCNLDEAREAGIPDQPLDSATRAELAVQLVAARAAALRYPTVADAVAAGFIEAGKFSPETGAHYVKLALPGNGSFDASDPSSFIYDGDSPTSKVIGDMYLAGGGGPAPEGFAGPNDHWHRHRNTCVIFGPKIVVPFAADSSVTAAQCAAKHGTFMKTTVWMVHAWVVPSWESPLGVFSHENPDVKCADGTYKADSVGFCKGT
jgi:hypothetical protein